MTLTASTDANIFPFNPGYIIVEQLYEISITAVARALATADRCLAALDLLGQEYPSLGELAHFCNQYMLTNNLNFSGV